MPIANPKPRKNMGHMRPGVKSPDKRMAQMLRVDHAGEYGATRIYQGQLAVFGKRGTKQASTETIRHMEQQEQVHLETFNRIINERQVRPTALTPLWHVAGYALGATTALMGEKAAMACTAAVEDVIDRHYQDQLDEISEDEAELRETIARFREEEIEHHDIAIEQGAEETPGYRLLSNAIKAGTRLAIRLSEKV